MKLSTKGRYGLRAMVDLATHSAKEPVSIQSIANRQAISDCYLEQLFRKLKKSNLITSIRGAQGGYILARSASEISVGDILRSLEGDLAPVECVELNQENTCAGSDSCVTKYVWKRINDSITDTVDSILLSDLIRNQTGNETDHLAHQCKI
ncbi:MAG: RrF2 family transcriptional regulator [Lachnospiraceae bacterium]